MAKVVADGDHEGHLLVVGEHHGVEQLPWQLVVGAVADVLQVRMEAAVVVAVPLRTHYLRGVVAHC